ncbi:MAG: T9SS type A sorting domain-containing protein, partial [Bacteroidota bacterium]
MKKINIIIFGTILFSTLCYSQEWDTLGSGFPYSPRCLYVDTSENILYAGGYFLYAGGVRVDGIARWDGTKWDSLAGGAVVYGSSSGSCMVNAITKYQGNIYAGGEFFDGVNTEGIALWDGIKWCDVGITGFSNSLSTSNSVVNSIYVYDGELYAGGYFDSIDGIRVKNLAKWNGIQWSVPDTLQLCDWLFLNVGCMKEYQGDLYFAGNFGGTQDSIKEIGRFDGQNWFSVGGGIKGDTWVHCIEVYQDELYVGGYFTALDGNVGNYIMRWDGYNWKDVGGGVMGGGGYNGQVTGMTIYNNELWVVGVFEYAGGVPTKYIAKWNGSEWCGIGEYFDNTLAHIAILNNEIIVAGGGKELLNGLQINYIAKWTGGNYVDTCGVINNLREIKEGEEKSIIYPNPAQDEITIETSDINNEFFEISIYSAVGKQVGYTAQQKNQKNFTLSVGELSNGLYLIKYVSEKETKTAK